MTATRPRVLYVTAGFPFPLSSGYLRHHHLLGQLAPQHHLHLLALGGPRFRPEHVHGVEGLVHKVEVVPRFDEGRRRTGQLLHPGRPDASARALARVVDDEIRAGRVDVVVLSGKETAVVADVVAGRVPLVVDLCDATSVRVGQELHLAGPARRAALMVRRNELRRVERRLIAAADVLLIASERDRTTLAEQGAPHAVLGALVVPNGIDLQHWRRNRQSLGDAVVFCGNLGYRPNADAALRLAHEVMPRVWAERPRAELVVVGADASPALAAALAHPRISATGTVDDVRPHLERGAVFVAPLRVATGIQNKLLEALALELPVVTSTVAAAGLVLGHDHPPLRVADTDHDVATAVSCRLDAVAAGHRAPHREGRAWVAGRFRWDRSGQVVADAVARLTGAPAPC